MTYTAKEVLTFVSENDIKFVRLAFCDLLGVQKNISIMASELERAFTGGISFDGSSIDGFLPLERSDLLLHPDPGTLRILPWRPQQGRVARFFCNIAHPGGEPFVGDARRILAKAAARAADMGLGCKVGAECEFYLFKTDENGEPTTIPLDKAGYMDIAPADKGENVRREVCLALEQMGIAPESSHHEQGPGQNEIDFRFGDVLTAADDLITFRSVVDVIAASNGLAASFLPKPLAGGSGSGLHVNLSLAENGGNIFKTGEGEHSPTAESFIAGILERTAEITAVANPLEGSYARLGRGSAPKYVSWSHQNRSQLIRIPAATGEHARMELRSPDPAANPYLLFALLVQAGLDGVEKKLQLPPPVDKNMYDEDREATGLARLPESLGEALDLMENSAFVKGVLGEENLQRYLELKRRETR